MNLYCGNTAAIPLALVDPMRPVLSSTFSRSHFLPLLSFPAPRLSTVSIARARSLSLFLSLVAVERWVVLVPRLPAYHRRADVHFLGRVWASAAAADDEAIPL